MRRRRRRRAGHRHASVSCAVERLIAARAAPSGRQARAIRQGWRRVHNHGIVIYKFKSAAAGDVIMLGPNGDQLLRLLKREPAARGIIEPADMPAASAALQAAVAAEEARQAEGAEGAEGEPARPAVSLRQRLWPMIEMLRRCHAAGKPVVWGV